MIPLAHPDGEAHHRHRQQTPGSHATLQSTQNCKTSRRHRSSGSFFSHLFPFHRLFATAAEVVSCIPTPIDLTLGRHRFGGTDDDCFPAECLLPCPALACPALPCPALPCSALPCPALPCPALPCPALPCPALLFTVMWTCRPRMAGP